MRHRALLVGLPVTNPNCRRRNWGWNKWPQIAANCTVKSSLKWAIRLQAKVAAIRRDQESSVLKAPWNALLGVEQNPLQLSD